MLTCLSISLLLTNHPLNHYEGFHLSLRGGHPCLALLVPTWKLDSRWKFLFACGCVVTFAIGVEGLTKLRQRRRVAVVSPLLHGMQAFAGYLLMLIAMTYSLELLLSVIGGLAIGYRLFFYHSPASHTTANPCCDFLDVRQNDPAATTTECCEPLLLQTNVARNEEEFSPE